MGTKYRFQAWAAALGGGCPAETIGGDGRGSPGDFPPAGYAIHPG